MKPPLKARLRQFKAAQKAQKENELAFGFVPRWLVPSKQKIKWAGITAMVTIGGLAGWALMRNAQPQTPNRSNPNVPQPDLLNRLSAINATHSSNHSVDAFASNTQHPTLLHANHSTLTPNSTQRMQNYAVFDAPSLPVNGSTPNGVCLNDRETESTQAMQQALLRDHMQALQNYFPEGLIKALGGIQRVASYPLIEGDSDFIGYELDTAKIQAPITLSTDGRHYYVTLAYKVSDGKGNYVVQTETFGQNGYSGGVKDNQGKHQERAVHLGFTRRDYDYIRRLRQGETVLDRTGSMLVNLSNFKMDKGDHPDMRKDLDECIQQEEEVCPVNVYTSSTMKVRLKTS